MAKSATQTNPEKESPALEPAGLPKPGDVVASDATKFYKGQLSPFRAEQIRVIYAIMAEDGHTLDDVQKPEYWKNVTQALEYGYRVEILFTGEDPRWVDLIVVAKGNTWAKVKILQNVSLAAEAQEALGLRAAEETHAHRVFHKGGQQKWVVQRKVDNAILSDSHATQKAAEDWLDDHKKTLRR